MTMASDDASIDLGLQRDINEMIEFLRGIDFPRRALNDTARRLAENDWKKHMIKNMTEEQIRSYFPTDGQQSIIKEFIKNQLTTTERSGIGVINSTGGSNNRNAISTGDIYQGDYPPPPQRN